MKEKEEIKYALLKKLHKLRVMNDYTETYVGAQLGLSQSQYGKFERNGSGLTFERVTDLAKLYGMTWAQLLLMDEAETVKETLKDHHEHCRGEREMLREQLYALKEKLAQLEVRVSQ